MPGDVRIRSIRKSPMPRNSSRLRAPGPAWTLADSNVRIGEARGQDRVAGLGRGRVEVAQDDDFAGRQEVLDLAVDRRELGVPHAARVEADRESQRARPSGSRPGNGWAANTATSRPSMSAVALTRTGSWNDWIPDSGRRLSNPIPSTPAPAAGNRARYGYRATRSGSLSIAATCSRVSSWIATMSTSSAVSPSRIVSTPTAPNSRFHVATSTVGPNGSGAGGETHSSPKRTTATTSSARRASRGHRPPRIAASATRITDAEEQERREDVRDRQRPESGRTTASKISQTMTAMARIQATRPAVLARPNSAVALADESREQFVREQPAARRQHDPVVVGDVHQLGRERPAERLVERWLVGCIDRDRPDPFEVRGSPVSADAVTSSSRSEPPGGSTPGEPSAGVRAAR